MALANQRVERTGAQVNWSRAGVGGRRRSTEVVSRTSIRMVVRHATPEDSRAIATIHVLSWQAAYQGVVPAQFLASMSVDQRE